MRKEEEEEGVQYKEDVRITEEALIGNLPSLACDYIIVMVSVALLQCICIHIWLGIMTILATV